MLLELCAEIKEFKVIGDKKFDADFYLLTKNRYLVSIIKACLFKHQKIAFGPKRTLKK